MTTEEIQMNNPPEGYKPFNLERALAGDPVVTRHGEPVTQITKFDHDGTRPLRGVVEGQIDCWFEDGCYYPSGKGRYDLFMAPKKRTMWVNLYPVTSTYLSAYAHAFEDKDEADNSAMHNRIGNRAWPLEIEE